MSDLLMIAAGTALGALSAHYLSGSKIYPQGTRFLWVLATLLGGMLLGLNAGVS